MILDLARALPGALAAVVLPGYFWAAFLCPVRGLAERLAYSTVLSMASVPVVALLLARIAGTGVTLWVAIGAVVIVFGSGVAAYLLRGAAAGSADPVLPRPAVIRDPRVLALTVGGLLLALVSIVRSPAPGWLLGLTAVVLLLAGVLAVRTSGPPAEARPPGDAGGPAADGSPGAAGPSGTPDGRPYPAAGSAAAPPGHGPAGQGPAAQGPAAQGPATARGPAATIPVPSPPARTMAPRTTAPRTATASTTTGRTAAASVPARPRSVLHATALTVVLALTAIRAYAAPVRYDWPYLRGSDLFSHAVMAEQMLSHGSYGSYLIYPPGFSTLTAVICRLSGLTPLALFPVLAPTLLLVTALGAYALATRLWGWEYGVAAAALSGLVLNGSYAGFAEGRYPDLVSAFFLIVMTVAALLTLYDSATFRSGLLVAVVGASVVLYHSVASLYLALLLALVAVTGLPYLLLRGRRKDARAMLFALLGLGILAVCYAWETYQLGKTATGGSATSTAVSIAVGSQPVPSAVHLLTQLSPAIVWLGAFGVAAMAMGLRYLRSPSQVLAAGTVLLWCVLMYAGSRTASDGFPQRFERDIGAPLSVIGALGCGLIVVSLLHWWRASERSIAAPAALAAAGALVLVVAVQAIQDLRADVRPAGDVLSAHVAAAGKWLAAHNTGGNIISTPYMNHGISNRAVLALGDYTGLQAYREFRILHPRSLPPAGRQPLLDSQSVLLHPTTCQAASILVRDDIRYVVLYKVGNGADVPAFGADHERYRRVFENKSVIIYAAAHAACPG